MSKIIAILNLVFGIGLILFQTTGSVPEPFNTGYLGIGMLFVGIKLARIEGHKNGE